MIKSMTGFGRERRVIGSREILVEIRSVNHRYYEFTAKTPRAYGYLDEKLKAFMHGAISRGKVEVSVAIYNQEGVNANIEINKEIAEGYINALRDSAEDLGLEDDLKLSNVIRLPDVFTVVKVIDDEEEIWQQVSEVAGEALKHFVEMRETEGVKMYDDITSRLDMIEETVGKIEKLSPASVQAYRQRLYDKIAEVVGDRNIDEGRILTEAAIFADKIAVDEETVRLRSHIAQFRELLDSGEPVGRKIDFLIQEMNREVNTTGSKAQELEITRMVVDMKAEIEKIREQIQNIE
ncbi:TIGR00255 family protein [Ruminococcaceae bacterium FB2012]|nr:TIGR00255 family protein [Ruminococcaceae bacterium FB2012]